MMKHGDRFYSHQEGAELLHKTVDEAVEHYLEEAQVARVEPGSKLVVHKYAREPVKEPSFGSSMFSPLEAVLGQLDDRYGDPEDASTATEHMLELERAFIAAVTKAYVPWSCVQTPYCLEVDLHEWCAEHRPELVGEPAAADPTSWPIGTRVALTEDDGSTTTTVTRSVPWQLGDGTWVVLVHGRAGGYLLERMREAPIRRTGGDDQ